MITLPKKPIKSITGSPKKLLIFSQPKVGKTTLLAGLPNCLIIDTEDGSDYIDGLKVKATNLDELVEVARAIRAENEKQGKKVYDYIAIDTITAMEDIAKELALKNYKNSAIGKNFEGDVHKFMQLPKGAAYVYLREAFEQLYNFFSKLTPHLILVGHLKMSAITKDGAGEVMASDIDLTGKIRNNTCADMDAIGRLYRKGSQSILSFHTSDDDLICGARSPHLRNKEIELCDYNDESGEFTYHWDKIFIDG